jgi:hypothetical protein
MPSDLENSVRSAAEKVAQYISDAAVMRVDTSYVDISDNTPERATIRPAAQTEIRLDGDSKTIVPMRRAQNGDLEVENELLDIHERNVATTIEYRSRVLSALLGLLQRR